MNTPIKLSVSSILLAGILSGCSQQQIQPEHNNHYEDAQVAPASPVIHKSKQAHQKRTNTSNKNIGLPPAQPGQCYAKTKQAAQYKTLTKRVLTQKATAKRVLVRGPQFRWTNKKVLIKPATHTQRVIPAQYKHVTKKIMVKPSYLTWKKGTGLITRIDNSTGEILCRVKVPAVYKNVTRKVLVRPARTIRTPVPATYKNIKTKQQISPAQYKTVKTPARYTNKQYRVKKVSAKYVWRQVLCKTNAPHAKKPRTHTVIDKHPQYRTLKAKPQQRSTHHVARAHAKPQQHKHSYKPAIKQHSATKNHNYKKAVYTKKTATPKMIRANTHSQSKAETENDLLHRAAAELQKTNVIQQPKKTKKQKQQLTRANAVFRIQSALAKRGYSPGKIDGKLGPGTVAALTAFQHAQGLQTGKLNRATLKSLGLI